MIQTNKVFFYHLQDLTDKSIFLRFPCEEQVFAKKNFSISFQLSDLVEG